MLVPLANSTFNNSVIQICPGLVLAENHGAYYRDILLRQMLLPDICVASGSEFFSRTVPYHIMPMTQ